MSSVRIKRWSDYLHQIFSSAVEIEKRNGATNMPSGRGNRCRKRGLTIPGRGKFHTEMESDRN
jgi:hypothetical protein